MQLVGINTSSDPIIGDSIDGGQYRVDLNVGGQFFPIRQPKIFLPTFGS